ncbi:MAG TPA: hypothetical protein VK960_08825 [Acidimicrobiia bacterium]|nr:hypothetical protein [Acidimicrobiia bacterium]
MKKRVTGSLVIAAGIALIAITVARNLFAVGPAFENLIDDFRPWLTDETIATLQADLDGLGGAVESIQTGMIPDLAAQLNVTPEELAATIGEQFPDVATGLQVVPQASGEFAGIIGLLDEQQANFLSADEIPTADLPATTVPWGFLAAGVLALVVGVAMLRFGRWGDIAAVALGALLVVAAVVLSLPGKASDADDLNAALKPVYTEEMVTGASGAVAALGAMGDEMSSAMLPGLGQMLGMTPEEVQGFIQQSYPEIAGAMQAMPDAIGRFDAMVATFAGNLDNYETLRPVAFVPIVWTMVGAGAVILLAGLAALFPPAVDRRRTAVESEPRVPVGV